VEFFAILILSLGFELLLFPWKKAPQEYFLVKKLAHSAANEVSIENRVVFKVKGSGTEVVFMWVFQVHPKSTSSLRSQRGSPSTSSGQARMWFYLFCVELTIKNMNPRRVLSKWCFASRTKEHAEIKSACGMFTYFSVGMKVLIPVLLRMSSDDLVNTKQIKEVNTRENRA